MHIVNKRRVLIPIVGKGSVIHLIRTGMIDGMRFFCTPVIGFSWNQPDLMQELEAKGYEVYLLPSYEISQEYKHLRKNIDHWYFQHILKTPSTKIQKRLKDGYRGLKGKIRSMVLEKIQSAKTTIIPSYGKRQVAREQQLIKTEQTYWIYEQWLKQHQIDGFFTVTPFIPEIELFARILKIHQQPVVASIHSFDNVTKRGWPALTFDSYLVWNKYNKQELLRINKQIKENDILIAGAPQFDFHYNNDFHVNKQQWLQKMGIPEGRKIVLYAGSVPAFFPDEPQYVLQLGKAIEEGKFGDNVVLLLRNHPLDNIQRWKNAIPESAFIFYDISTGGEKKMDHSNVTNDDLKQLIASLRYTDVHINLCSTMAVDGSVFLKPQIGPAYNEVNEKTTAAIKRLYYQEHYLPIMKTGVVKLADSSTELVRLVAEALQNPSDFTMHSRHCVEEIITYTDGNSTNRVLNVLKSSFA